MKKSCKTCKFNHNWVCKQYPTFITDYYNLPILCREYKYSLLIHIKESIIRELKYFINTMDYITKKIKTLNQTYKVIKKNHDTLKKMFNNHSTIKQKFILSEEILNQSYMLILDKVETTEQRRKFNQIIKDIKDKK